MIECNKCKKPMKIIRTEQELMPSSITCSFYDMSEGQMAEYMAAEMSGDFGDWTVDVVTCKCPKCGKTETERNI